MVLVLELLQLLTTHGAQSASELANSLGKDIQATQAALDLAESRGEVTKGGSAWSAGETGHPIYTITQGGSETYARVLGRYQHVLSPTLSATERFIFALRDDVPNTTSNLVALADPDYLQLGDDATERRRVMKLAGASTAWAHTALSNAGPECESCVKGLESLATSTPDDFAYAAGMLQQYAAHVQDPGLREVVASAAETCAFAGDLRQLGPRRVAEGGGAYSEARPFEPETAIHAARSAAETLNALARLGLADRYDHARTIAEKERPPR